MRFCPWYPLAEAGDRTPAGEGVLQLRVPEGLLDYPTGKSAMVHYAHAMDVRAAALGLAAVHHDLLCRHLDPEGEAVDYSAFHAKVLDEFVRRFGIAPRFP
ncbi:MAG: hypothetical protein QM831_33995 [Kofleriaceae bacterium]